jgi:hypothetical protein
MVAMGCCQIFCRKGRAGRYMSVERGGNVARRDKRRTVLRWPVVFIYFLLVKGCIKALLRR